MAMPPNSAVGFWCHRSLLGAATIPVRRAARRATTVKIIPITNVHKVATVICMNSHSRRDTRCLQPCPGLNAKCSLLLKNERPCCDALLVYYLCPVVIDDACEYAIEI